MPEHGIYRTTEPCWKCSTLLLQVDPPLHGWTHSCVRCQHMTSPQAVLDAAMRDKPADALGIVSAWPVRLDVEYIAPNRS